jgi:DNA-binding CsgD family transcriptional regulator
MSLADVSLPIAPESRLLYQLARVGLTKTEISVALLLRQSMSTKAIAQQFGVSVETVNSHRKRLRKKLGLSDRSVSLLTFLVAIEGMVE